MKIHSPSFSYIVLKRAWLLLCLGGLLYTSPAQGNDVLPSAEGCKRLDAKSLVEPPAAAGAGLDPDWIQLLQQLSTLSLEVTGEISAWDDFPELPGSQTPNAPECPPTTP